MGEINIGQKFQILKLPSEWPNRYSWIVGKIGTVVALDKGFNVFLRFENPPSDFTLDAFSDIELYWRRFKDPKLIKPVIDVDYWISDLVVEV